ncbi:hypothetical protein [Luteolibacter marinus]|uniref:hypothetical protein n=1 Tax=Luteolibacter marinus TaxID=2776705 RepID=UPI00186900E4|nr:hypothetical protein [Luteolibacter marinus]
MGDPEGGYFTPVRIAFWFIMAALFGAGLFLWFFVGIPHRHPDSRPAFCILNQRNLQQVVRNQQSLHHLEPGDPLDWSELVGPGRFIEEMPVCPVHGSYPLSPVVPEPGVLAAPCPDPEHQPANIRDW